MCTLHHAHVEFYQAPCFLHASLKIWEESGYEASLAITLYTCTYMYFNRINCIISQAGLVRMILNKNILILYWTNIPLLTTISAFSLFLWSPNSTSPPLLPCWLPQRVWLGGATVVGKEVCLDRGWVETQLWWSRNPK